MDSHILILLFVVVLVVGILWNNRAAIFGMAAAGSYVVARDMQSYSDRDSVHGGVSYGTIQMYQLINKYFEKYGIGESAIVKRGLFRSDIRRPVNSADVINLRKDTSDLKTRIESERKSDYTENRLWRMLNAVSGRLFGDSVDRIRTHLETEMINHQRTLRQRIDNTRIAIENYKNSESKYPGGIMPMIYYLTIWDEITFHDIKNDSLLWGESEQYSLHTLRETLKHSEGSIWATNLTFTNSDGDLIEINVFDAIESGERARIHDECSKAIAALYALSNTLSDGGSSDEASHAAANAIIHFSDQSQPLMRPPRNIDIQSESQVVLNANKTNLANMEIEAEQKRKSEINATVNELMSEVNKNAEKWKSENKRDDEVPEIKPESEYVVPRVPDMPGDLAHQQVPESKSEPTVVRIIPLAPDHPAPRRVPESKSEPSIVKKILYAPARDAPRRILTAPPLEPDEDSLISIPKKIGRMLYPPGYVPYRYRRARTESDDEDSDDYHLSLNPRDCENVARYRARYGKDALVNELVRQLHEFPGTNLLTRDSISTMDPAVHIKHYMSSALKHSRLSGERSPAESWSHENSRRKFFDSLVTANPKYCVNNTDLWSAADKFLKYVPIAPVRAISDLITKYDPRQILDVNVMFGSSIAALALATPQSAMYTGLCKSGFRLELGILANRISGRSTFPARITLLSDSIMDYRPAAGGFDMIICEIRARGSEILPTGVPESQYSDTHSWLTQYVDPILTKISAAMTTGAHVIFMTTVVNPDTAELWKHIGQKYTAAGSAATTSAGYSILTVTKK